jgi:hypothetical protein
MADSREIRDLLGDHLGDSIHEPVNVDPHADPDEGWTPPALNDNRRLKASIMDAMQGKQAPAQGNGYDDIKAQIASIQADINRLDQTND